MTDVLWHFLRWLTWPEHEHVWQFRDIPIWQFRDQALVIVGHNMAWACRDCPAREYLGLACPDASNRRTAA